MLPPYWPANGEKALDPASAEDSWNTSSLGCCTELAVLHLHRAWVKSLVRCLGVSEPREKLSLDCVSMFLYWSIKDISGFIFFHILQLSTYPSHRPHLVHKPCCSTPAHSNDRQIDVNAPSIPSQCDFKGTFSTTLHVIQEMWDTLPSLPSPHISPLLLLLCLSLSPPAASLLSLYPLSHSEHLPSLNVYWVMLCIHQAREMVCVYVTGCMSCVCMWVCLMGRLYECVSVR